MPGGGSSRREGGQGWMVLTAWVFAMSLFWRVFAANAAILTAGALVLAFAPGPLRKYRALIDLGGLLIGQAA